jgi:hypothetical protein
MPSNDMPFENRNKYGGDSVDWEDSADEFAAALGGHSDSGRRSRTSDSAAQSTDDTVDTSIFGEAGSPGKYLGRS